MEADKMKFTAPLSTVLAVAGYLAGAGATICGFVNAGNWNGAEQAIMTAIGGAALLITHHHVTNKTVNAPPPA
jgi:hypothetical protein